MSGTLAAFGSPVATYLSASLTGTTTGVSGTAHYEADSISGDSGLRVRVSGLTADATYAVQIGGTTVGSLNTDANGRGFVSTSNPSATISSGTVLTVLDSTSATALPGTFAADTGWDGWGHRW
jgi:hypothetical protein